VPRGVSNLLLAGRCVSAEYHALGALRSQAAGMLTGQAVGTAAALAVQGKIEPRKVDVARLQEVLVSQNQII
jgi:hypothetical protein